MDATPNLGLPYILAAQSQKHVTHNEAIRARRHRAALGARPRPGGAARLAGERRALHRGGEPYWRLVGSRRRYRGLPGRRLGFRRGRLRVQGMELRGSVGLYAYASSVITVSSAMRFGKCGAYQMYASRNGIIDTDVAAYTICGTGAIDHLALDDGGIVVLTSTTVTLVGSQAWSGAFASSNGPGACSQGDRSIGAVAEQTPTYLQPQFLGAPRGERSDMGAGGTLLREKRGPVILEGHERRLDRQGRLGHVLQIVRAPQRAELAAS